MNEQGHGTFRHRSTVVLTNLKRPTMEKSEMRKVFERLSERKIWGIGTSVSFHGGEPKDVDLREDFNQCRPSLDSGKNFHENVIVILVYFICSYNFVEKAWIFFQGRKYEEVWLILIVTRLSTNTFWCCSYIFPSSLHYIFLFLYRRFSLVQFPAY